MRAPDVLVKMDVVLLFDMATDSKYDQENILSLKCEVMGEQLSRFFDKVGKKKSKVKVHLLDISSFQQHLMILID